MEKLAQLRHPSPTDPLRILSSACLLGFLCGYDESSYGSHPHILRLWQEPKVEIYRYCPEDAAFGTPRELCDIHGGNGFDVLEGKAKVINERGLDWTEPMLRVSERMLQFAQENKVELCILMDMSAACGSQVISDGSRLAADRKYQKGPGVCAAQLMRHGFTVISQRDFASLEQLYAKIDAGHEIDVSAKDYHETDWYKAYFNASDGKG